MEFPRVSLLLEHLKSTKKITTPLSKSEQFIYDQTQVALEQSLIKRKDIEPFVNGVIVGIFKASELITKIGVRLQ